MAGLAQFDLARKRAQEQETQALQGQKDALARRQAQLGGGVSGALLKQENVAADQSAKRLQSANEGINAQESAEVERRNEIKEGRDFQASEAQKGRDFTAGESAMQRRFLTTEREAGQGFAAGQADLQRKFQTGERLGAEKFQAGESAAARTQQNNQFLAAQNQQNNQFLESQKQQNNQYLASLGLSKDQFEHEKAVDAFNMDLATKMFNKKDMLESFFGNFSTGNTFGKLAKGLQPAGEDIGQGLENFFGGIFG